MRTRPEEVWLPVPTLGSFPMRILERKSKPVTRNHQTQLVTLPIRGSTTHGKPQPAVTI